MTATTLNRDDNSAAAALSSSRTKTVTDEVHESIARDEADARDRQWQLARAWQETSTVFGTKERAVYGVLWYFAKRTPLPPHDPHYGADCWKATVTHDAIAKRTSLSKQNVIRVLRGLAGEHVIATEMPTLTASGWSGNTYVLTHPGEHLLLPPEPPRDGSKARKNRGIALAWGKRFEDLSVYERAVLGILLAYVRKSDRLAYPRWSLISKRSGVKRSTLAKAFTGLEAHGLVIRHRHAKGQPDPRHPERELTYRLTVYEVPRIGGPAPRQRKTGNHRNGDLVPTKRGRGNPRSVDPEPTKRGRHRSHPEASREAVAEDTLGKPADALSRSSDDDRSTAPPIERGRAKGRIESAHQGNG